MNCFKVRVPDDRPLRGFTATGEPVRLYPGEYLVHCLAPKADGDSRRLLRFVGADAWGRDVHVPMEAGADLEALAAQGDPSPSIAARPRPQDRCRDAHDTRSRAVAAAP